MRALRVVLSLTSPVTSQPKVRFTGRFRRWTPARVQEFEEESARIEAQLLVLAEDIERCRFTKTQQSLVLRRRRLEITRGLLYRQTDVADRMCHIRPPLTRVFDRLIAIDDRDDTIDDAESLLGSNTLAKAPINLNRLIDLFQLYREIRRQLR